MMCESYVNYLKGPVCGQTLLLISLSNLCTHYNVTAAILVHLITSTCPLILLTGVETAVAWYPYYMSGMMPNKILGMSTCSIW